MNRQCVETREVDEVRYLVQLQELNVLTRVRVPDEQSVLKLGRHGNISDKGPREGTAVLLFRLTKSYTASGTVV